MIQLSSQKMQGDIRQGRLGGSGSGKKKTSHIINPPSNITYRSIWEVKEDFDVPEHCRWGGDVNSPDRIFLKKGMQVYLNN